MGFLGNPCGPSLPTPFVVQAQRALYNPKGLQKWWQSLYRTRKKNDGSGAGGVFIQCIGDSDTQGAGPEMSAATLAWTTWPHYLSRLLQRHLNPVSVTGGYGHLPVDRG